MENDTQDLSVRQAKARDRYAKALLEGGKRAVVENILNRLDALELKSKMEMDVHAVDDLDFASLLDNVVERHEESWADLFQEWEDRMAHLSGFTAHALLTGTQDLEAMQYARICLEYARMATDAEDAHTRDTAE